MPSPDCPNAGSRSRQRPVARSGSPRCQARAVTTLAASVVVALAVVHCGGSHPSSPTSPTPAPVPSLSPACGAISGGLGVSLGIVNGSICSSVNSSVVLVERRDEAGMSLGYCSGTVIAPRAVLTAAHCLGTDTAAVDIDPGSGGWLAAASFAPHPTYPASSLDVGVILMREDLPRTPLPILTSRETEVGESAVIAGWGRDGDDIPRVLRAGIVTITHGGVGFIQTEYLGTGAGSGTCAGDSGGPLMLSEGGTWVVAGVASAVSQVDACWAAKTSYYAVLRNADILAFVTSLVPDVQGR